jgi:hypothetical protein
MLRQALRSIGAERVATYCQPWAWQHRGRGCACAGVARSLRWFQLAAEGVQRRQPRQRGGRGAAVLRARIAVGWLADGDCCAVHILPILALFVHRSAVRHQPPGGGGRSGGSPLRRACPHRGLGHALTQGRPVTAIAAGRTRRAAPRRSPSAAFSQPIFMKPHLTGGRCSSPTNLNKSVQPRASESIFAGAVSRGCRCSGTTARSSAGGAPTA